MIKYNNSTINDWFYGSDNLIKIYRNNAICYYKVAGTPPSPTAQTPCYAVVEDISQYSDTEFEDVYNKADSSWYKLNNLNQYEEYGIYGSGRTECSGGTPSRLPSGYTEVEYIENTGTSYINTNIQIYSSTTDSFEIESKLIAAMHDSQSYYQNVFSCMSEDGEPYQGFTYRYHSSSLESISIPDGQNTFTIVNNEDSTQTVTVTSSSSQRTYTHTYPLTLFCGLNSSRSPFRWTNSKFYYCKIKINNELVGDFVPAKRDSDDKYGLYDLITDTFYVSPNGYNFAGGEPVNPQQQCVTTYEGKLTIDDGYEYIYSGGSWVSLGEVSGETYLEYLERDLNYNGYVPLGEYFTENTVIDIDFQMTQAKGNAVIGDYGSNDNDDWRVFINYDVTVNNYIVYDFINNREYYNSGDWSQRFHLEIGNYYIKDLNTGNYLINTSAKSGFSRPNQMYLFHMEGTQTTNNIDYGHIYSVKIYQNNVLVKDYIPWTDGNGNYGLYDKISSSATQSIGSMTGHMHSDIVYPMYYDTIQDPPDNVSFSSMTEAEDYECPWWGMTGIIDNTDYLFCETNTWLTKYIYQEVTGDYICNNGNKYKKMQEYDRNVDGSTSATTNYVPGDLIESGSTDCQTYTEIEYIEWRGDSTSGGGVQLLTNVTSDYYFEADSQRIAYNGSPGIVHQKSSVEIVGYQMGLCYYDSMFLDYGGGRLSTSIGYDIQSARHVYGAGHISGSSYPNVVGVTVDGVVNNTTNATTTVENLPYLVGNLGYTGHTASDVKIAGNNNDDIKLWSVKIYSDYGDTLVGDYIPVLDANNNPTLYDKVSGNYATVYGTIIAGPTKNN